MDLTKGPPRSPYTTLGGIVSFPRCIDKMRAALAGTPGDYQATTGNVSTMLFALLGITPEAFAQIVREHPTDDGVLRALHARRPLTAEEIARWNHASVTRGPENDERWERHWRILREIGQGHRRDVTTVFDRLLLEDGVEVPVRTAGWLPDSEVR